MTAMPRHSWKSIREVIHGRILDTTFGPGDKLPKDEVFAEELGCARATVQRAMRDLADSGVVERRRKGGTHVSSTPVTRATLSIPITRREIEQKGSVYGYQLISLEEAETPYAVAANFELTSAVKMLRVKAIHMADGRPYVYEDRWVSIQTVPEILDVDLTVESANEWLVRNKPFNRCDLRFYAQRAGNYHAELFGCDDNEALFVTERTTWQNRAPITSLKAVAGPGYQLVTQA